MVEKCNVISLLVFADSDQDYLIQTLNIIYIQILQRNTCLLWLTYFHRRLPVHSLNLQLLYLRTNKPEFRIYSRLCMCKLIAVKPLVISLPLSLSFIYPLTNRFCHTGDQRPPCDQNTATIIYKS